MAKREIKWDKTEQLAQRKVRGLRGLTCGAKQLRPELATCKRRSSPPDNVDLIRRLIL